MKPFLLLAFALPLVLPGPAVADDCAALQGTWAGTISGRFSGPITISFMGGCSYNWVMTALTTSGAITTVDGQLRYANAAGSRGVVTRAGNTLTFKNKFTGDDYTVRVSRR